MGRSNKVAALILGVSLLGLSLTGCSSIQSTDTSGESGNEHMNHGSMHSMPITDKQSFAEAMIPHHQQAIDMSAFAVTNTTNPEVLAIAEKITSEQGPEIEKMTPWLNGRHVDYTMMMDGMLTPMQINTLRGVRNADFDKLYVQYMIQHHEGAVAMAGEALKVNDQELTAFANAIIVTQSSEIEELMALLKK